MIDTTRPQSWGAFAPRLVPGPWSLVRGRDALPTRGHGPRTQDKGHPLGSPETPEAALCWAILRQALVDAGFVRAGKSCTTQHDTAHARAWLLEDERGTFELVCEGCGLEWTCVRAALRARGGAAMG